MSVDLATHPPFLIQSASTGEENRLILKRFDIILRSDYRVKRRHAPTAEKRPSINPNWFLFRLLASQSANN